VAHWGSDLPGSFILGNGAYQKFLCQSQEPTDVIHDADVLTRYPDIAKDVLSFGLAGSSAAGEQPKFLATLSRGAALTPVLVKFSPPTRDSAARRVSDLLVCEHLALCSLARLGFPSPSSRIVQAGSRTFLEVVRFDRQGMTHRVGQVALDALDAEFVGSDLRSWTDSVRSLTDCGVVSATYLPRVRLMELFGQLIGNTDRHFGNLAFEMDGIRVTRLAPPYDMSPMHYFPHHTEPSDEPFPLPALQPGHVTLTSAAIEEAVVFWLNVAADVRISTAFRRLAADNAERVATLRKALVLLPNE
jgi:hypothetical protein